MENINFKNLTDNLDLELIKQGTEMLFSAEMTSMVMERSCVFDGYEVEALIYNPKPNKSTVLLPMITVDDNLDIKELFCICDSEYNLCPHVIALLMGAALMLDTETYELEIALKYLGVENIDDLKRYF